MGPVRALPRADMALAVALAVYALIEGLVIGAPVGWLAAAPLVSLSVAWRRRFPAAVVASALGLIVLPDVLTEASVGSVLPLPLIIICGFTAGREASSAREAAIGAVAVAAVLALGLLGEAETENSAAEDVIAFTVLVSGAAGVGRLIRVRQEENLRLHELTERLAAERDLTARAAVAEERARVARELHDVVAHSVSLIAVQAGAAENLIGRDEDRARQSMHAVQDAARGALGEMRRLLSVLRSDDGGLEPQPGLSDVPVLVGQVGAGGLPVTLREEGDRPEVPAGVDLSGYRIIQEALTNVRKHAGPVPTEVVVSYEPGAVVVQVANDDGGNGANGSGHGHGIPGMRERARLYGGTLDVERGDGRYVVRARLPVAEAEE